MRPPEGMPGLARKRRGCGGGLGGGCRGELAGGGCGAADGIQMGEPDVEVGAVDDAVVVEVAVADEVCHLAEMCEPDIEVSAVGDAVAIGVAGDVKQVEIVGKA